MARVRFNRGFNINTVVKRLIRTILALYVGGTVITTFGTVMTNTSSPFYSGLSLIGWTVGAQINNGTAGYVYACSGGGVQTAPSLGTHTGSGALYTGTSCITATSGSGVLAVVGIIAIAQIITEFITW